MKKNFNPALSLVLLVLLLCLIIGGPIATIEALNLLFGLSIPLTIWTYMAAWWVSTIFGGGQLRQKIEKIIKRTGV